MTTKSLEEEVRELERLAAAEDMTLVEHLEWTLSATEQKYLFRRLIDDWRARGERIEALRRDVEFYQLEAVARTGTDARTKP